MGEKGMEEEPIHSAGSRVACGSWPRLAPCSYLGSRLRRHGGWPRGSGAPTAARLPRLRGGMGEGLTARDGFNGVLRSVKQLVPPGADQAFLDGCLSTDERNRVLGAKHFHFAVISARRATSDEGQLGIMTVEAHFNAVGVKPTWYVDAESLQAYKSLGLSAVVGGKLTPARNLALDDAKSRRQVCVQISDDISKWEYFDVERQDFGGETSFQRANAAVCGAKRLCVSPLAAAQFILAKMRSSPSRPHLGGVFPTRNASMSLGQEEYSTHHFILGDCRG
ncbi:unnamed protein product [Prorocentrum cordatum]|uniref:Uncharacterized protein n=1 Tax=Prorocentrum cordatum TaxID=2364126 RepID=A0ABN9S703_9DINO|nr:unnamed protein product [Polarella glacialis]